MSMDVASDRVFAPQPARGILDSSLDVVPTADQAALKAQYHASNNAGVKGWTTADGVTITILSGPRYDADKRLVEVEIAATDAGGKALPVDNPYQFINPPLNVPDGTWRKVTLDTGETIDVMNTKEDVAAAFQIMITETVLGKASALGWAP